VALFLLLAGCASAPPSDRAARMTRGFVYYLDGAGGGAALRNYSSGVRQGLLEAGYPGTGEMFDWETGWGLLADQEVSVAYKRARAAELAQQIADFRRQHPHTPIELIGFSAGTAVAVFTLEALPDDICVQNVILLSGSLSADYDLAAALRHVTERVYVTTSHRDGMLLYLMPLTGTADRKPTTEGAIGIEGPRRPTDASPAVCQEYEKIVTLPWNAEFARLGDHGRHFDTVRAPFIQAAIAPLLMKDAVPIAATATEGMVANPDYARWEGFAPGSWSRLRGYELVRGKRMPLSVTVTLAARDPHRLFVQREFEVEDGGAAQTPLAGRFVLAARIQPEEHPLTAPGHTRTELPAREIMLAGRTWLCQGYQLRAPGEFPRWGTDVTATIYTHPDIPGHIARLELQTTINGQLTEFAAELVEFYAATADKAPLNAP
jgi:pimeloyl-ACP methyl ester carboxylesterase